MPPTSKLAVRPSFMRSSFVDSGQEGQAAPAQPAFGGDAPPILKISDENSQSVRLCASTEVTRASATPANRAQSKHESEEKSGGCCAIS